MWEIKINNACNFDLTSYLSYLSESLSPDAHAVFKNDVIGNKDRCRCDAQHRNFAIRSNQLINVSRITCWEEKEENSFNMNILDFLK